MKLWCAAVFGAIVVVAAAVLVSSASPVGTAWAQAGGAQAGGAQAPPPTPVEAVVVRRGPVLERVRAFGDLVSNESVVLRSEVAGRIQKIGFEEGQPVKAGQLLFQLDDATWRAAVAEAEARLGLARRNYSRTRELFERSTASGTAMDQTQAQLQIDEASVQLSKARLEQTRIPAPFDGVIGLRQVSVGDYVSPGQALVNLEDIDPIKVDFRIAERYLPALRVGQKIELDVDAFPGRAFAGEVYALDPAVDVAGRSVALRALVPNPQGLLKPGLFARVSLITTERPQSILVPEEAIVPRGAERFVFTVVDGKAKMAKVTLGLRLEGTVEVVEGLDDGALVVTAGQLKIRDGAPVRVIGEPRG